MINNGFNDNSKIITLTGANTNFTGTLCSSNGRSRNDFYGLPWNNSATLNYNWT